MLKSSKLFGTKELLVGFLGVRLVVASEGFDPSESAGCAQSDWRFLLVLMQNIQGAVFFLGHTRVVY